MAIWLFLPAAAMAGTAVSQEDAPRAQEEVVWIEVDENRPFPALFNRQEGNKDAVLILHDIISFANDSALIQPLREGLHPLGWDVLVPRLPVPPRLAKPDHFQNLLTAQSQRVLAAVAFLRQNDYRNIVVIGHGFGAFTAIMVLSHSTPATESVGAVINLNTDWYNYPLGRRILLRTIPSLSIPVLDIYSTNAHGNTVHNASNRDFVLKKLAAKDDLLSRQVSIPYRPHNLKGSERILLRAIDNWLQDVFPDDE